MALEHVDALIATVREAAKLRAEVRLAAPAALPSDGKVIEGARKYP